MRKIVTFLMNLGVTKGVTFRAEPEDGVGVFIVPNPRPTRMNPQAVPLTAGVPELTRRGTGRRFELLTPPGNRKQRRKASGCWIAKALHVSW